MDHGQPRREHFKRLGMNSLELWKIVCVLEIDTCSCVQGGSMANLGQRLALHEPATDGAIELAPRVVARPLTVAGHVAASIAVGSAGI